MLTFGPVPAIPPSWSRAENDLESGRLCYVIRLEYEPARPFPATGDRVKIVLLIRSLERGGAERQAVMLARGLRDAGVDVCVMVFYGGGAFERDLERAGIRQVVLGKSGRWDVVAFLQRLVRELRREKPDVVYGFMGTPNLLTVALRPLFPGVRMIWGVRSSRISHRDYDWLVRLHARMEGALAGFPDLVIVNSAAGARELPRRGFRSDKVVIVPNGIDSNAYQRDEKGRERVRREWGLE